MTHKRLLQPTFNLFINLNDNKLMNSLFGESVQVIKHQYRHCQRDHTQRRHLHHYSQYGRYSYYTLSYQLAYRLVLFVLMQLALEWTSALPKLTSDKSVQLDLRRVVWPPMRHYDIWADQNDEAERSSTFQSNWAYSQDYNDHDNDSDSDTEKFLFQPYRLTRNSFNDSNNLWKLNKTTDKPKRSKVLHIFPVPVDGECLSNDGRRTGSCFNAYECRSKGGIAKGDCAMGFGVCCIFEANCNETVSNNITYLVSPNFPSSMTDNFHLCNLKVKLLNDDISQLRIDFYHFTLGQPNRRTGVCDGDAFHVSGGPSGTFTLCGQNSGQHIYYDVTGRMTPRQTLFGTLRPFTYDELYANVNGTAGNETMEIAVSLNFSSRFLPTRLWEIRIAQIPFSQRAPAGCLQYFMGNEGIFQTFNFADNGRHLANQNYRICIRQETNMCSILYEPCDEESFRVGPSFPSMTELMQMQNSTLPTSTSSASMSNGLMMNSMMLSAAVTSSAMPSSTMSMGGSAIMFDGVGNQTQSAIMADSSSSLTMQTSSNAPDVPEMSSMEAIQMTSSQATPSSSAAGMPTAAMSSASMASSTTAAVAADDPSSGGSDQMDPPTMPTLTSAVTMPSLTLSSSTASVASSTQSDDVEGSGDDTNDNPLRPRPSRRPRPVTGGFDLLGFIRNAFNQIGLRQARIHRQKRQFFSTCRDRITMPCIIEDFLDGGLGPLPGCEPVHCGNQFCSSGIWPCRIESTVTPFYVGIHFGNGIGKGSAEDNIGACLKYQQIQCV